MPIRRPPLRFLALVIASWAGARGAWLVPWTPVQAALSEWHIPLAEPTPFERRIAALSDPVASSADLVPARAAPFMPPAVAAAGANTPPPLASGAADLERRLSMAVLLASATQPIRWTQPAGPVPRLDPAERAARFRASAWLFARSGSGRAGLAPGGQLGGSQAGLRVARSIGSGFAVAARVSAPLHDRRGLEAAVGLDWQPAEQVAVRLSAERRIALGAHARNAWSLYAAGGAWRQVNGIDLDAYAQAGLVGARAGDLFADGAIRAGRRVAGPLSLGAGAWGAAQPGVARLDVGPRAAVTLPLADAPATLALEGRLRVAGRAAPGSGVALTLATDF
ncbi:hypothetical protein [Sphingomonas jatrophae]|uniref:Uncharacterized protein n=1 Tax=Sphingomonas jatrophae TaxID=1166337 RepID=A0A1I6LRH2_9SPHN|nr:hypothetical protein [Sphingomonas jatrophae]SFS06056.1 hypothetical protein SAMN05192580_3173 [Sphingomonas jatrophae]